MKTGVNIVCVHMNNPNGNVSELDLYTDEGAGIVRNIINEGFKYKPSLSSDFYVFVPSYRIHLVTFSETPSTVDENGVPLLMRA